MENNLTLLNVFLDKDDIQRVSGRALHEYLGIQTRYTQWFARMLEYGFEEKTDYFPVSQKCESGGASGIKVIQDHYITLDMAKEIAMLQRNDMGKTARQYFIQIEKQYKSWLMSRARGIEQRHCLTDTIDEVTPDSPYKKFAYANITNLVYKTVFGKTCKELKQGRHLSKKANLRDYLSKVELSEIKRIEKLVDSFLGLGKTYKEIKEILEREYVPKLRIM